MWLYPSMWVSYLISMLVLQAATPTTASDIQLVNNGFEGVLISIDPMIDETYAKDINLLQAIKNTVTEGSQALFEATHNRAFFRKVNILIPNSWNNTVVDTTVSFNDKDGHFHIKNGNSVYGDQPYTQKTQNECGMPGEFIHLTPKYLTDDEKVTWYGNRGKNMAIEWARFRWGIFDEIGYPGDPEFPLFYQGTEFTFEPNFCAVTTVNGMKYVRSTRQMCKVNDDGSPDANCRFYPFTNNTQVKSSLLSYGAIKNNVSLFCDENTHNKMAPTKQNAFCNKQSAWSVIMDHKDFKNNSNAPITEQEEIQFQIVQQANHTNYILVLDYSGSMDGYERLVKLQTTTQRWIKYGVEEGNYVGIVKFASYAHRSLELTKITNDNRDSIANIIDTNTLGGTYIDSGVQEALKVLGGRPNCVLLVLTDGEDSQPIDPNSNAKAAGCKVITLAFGPSAADGLEDLARSTDGKTFKVDDGDIANTNLNDAFTFALKYQPQQDPSSINIKIHESDPYRGSDTNYTGTFVVDARMGRNLELRLMTDNFDHITTPPVLIGPNGTIYNATKKDSSSKVWIVQVKTVMNGTWRFQAGLSGSSGNFISSTVTCQPKAGEELPIMISVKTSALPDGVDLTKNQIVINCEVKQGNNPVIGAEVLAIVTLPNAPNIVLKLLDGGNEPDAIKGDGIYSRYLTGINDTGRASIKVKVTETHDSYILNPSISTRRKRSVTVENNFVVPMDIPEPCCGSYIPQDRFDAEPTGDFSRIESAGSVKITAVPPPGSDSFPPIVVRDLTTVENMTKNDNQESGLVYHTTFTWTAPGDDFDTGIVDSYSLRFSRIKADLSEDSFNSATEYPLSKELYSDIFQEAGTKISLKMSLNLTRFTEGVPYYFSLKAQDEKNNESPASNIVKLILPLSSPSITITNTTSSSLHITWTGNSPSITKYNVKLSSNSDNSISLEVGSDANSLGFGDLRCNTEYMITVIARSDQDVQNWANSASVNATTYDTVPGIPIIEKIYPNPDHTELVVQWSEAEYSCSGGLRNYHITWNTNNYTLNNDSLDDTTDNGTTLKSTISNILLDSTYNVTVAASSYTGILGPMQSQTFDTILSDTWTPGRWILCNCDYKKNHCDKCYVGGASSKAKEQPLSNKESRKKRSPMPLAQLISH